MERNVGDDARSACSWVLPTDDTPKGAQFDRAHAEPGRRVENTDDPRPLRSDDALCAGQPIDVTARSHGAVGALLAAGFDLSTCGLPVARAERSSRSPRRSASMSRPYRAWRLSQNRGVVTK
jgi:hypothetical protein